MINPKNKALKKINWKQEKIVKILHRHWFDILKHYLIIILVTLFLLISLFLIPAFFSSEQSEGGTNLLLFFESLMALFIWIAAFFVWIEYYFDVWIITNRKIVNIEQKGLFSRHVSELKYEKIQDVTVEVNGIIPTLLNYGDIHIQTAAEVRRFIFRSIPNPYGTKNLIMEMQKKRVRKRTNELSKLIKEGIDKEVA